MRGEAALIAALAAAACGDGLTDTEREVAGGYALVAVNGRPLPFGLDRPCGEQVSAGGLELYQENRYFVELTVLNPDCPQESASETWTGRGLWTVIEGQVRLVSDVGVQGLTFGSAPAPLDGTTLTAQGRIEVLGYEGDPVRPTLRPVPVTLTFAR